MYEAAFLRVFTQWEVLMEESSVRYMCGYSYGTYQPTYPGSTLKRPNIPAARHSLLNGKPYALWHDATRNADRVAKWVALCPVETVARSATTWLDPVSAIRHRIAHNSDDARQKFYAATLTLSGRRFTAGSVGRYLRASDPASSGRRLDDLVLRLKGLALQVAP